MRLFKVLFIWFLFVFAFQFSAYSQDEASVLNQIIEKSNKAYTNFPIEKVYLHFDKPYYAVGDTIWFKAYLTYGLHQPSPISKIIYVDLFGPKDSLIQALKLKVKNSVAWGYIPLLQNSYKKGNYRIVGYTNWMNNAGWDYFFNKNITIGDAINNDVRTQISFKKTVFNRVQKISSGIFFKDDNGNPYVGKKISWTVYKEGESIFKGKAETDKTGFADINFLNPKNIGLDSTVLVTSFENNNDKQVLNQFSLKSIAKPNDIQFFPEGGQLLIGLRTKIAFKAVKPDGLGIELKGTITDNDNNLVTEFSSTHLGMGFFMFTPEDNKTYHVNVTFADGTSVSPELPKIQSNGININLDNKDPNQLSVKIQADQTFFNEYKDKTFFIICKSNGAICYAAKTNLSVQAYTSNIQKDKFPTGIVQVTLFTSDGEPISERIAFIKHKDYLTLGINSDHPSYTTRQKVKLYITAKNNNLPVEGNFSVSVIDETKVPFSENKETSILSYLLLTSDIKGYIEEPNYYFIQEDEKTNSDLDVLLQTQGYRRFSYDGILNNKTQLVNYFVEQGIDISGTLRASNGLPINHGNVSISIPDKNYYKTVLTDPDGKFKFTDLDFLDSAKVKISARNNAHASDLVISIDGEQPQRIGLNYNAPDEILNIDSVLSAYLKNSKLQYTNTHVLKEVVIRDKRIVNKVSHKDYSSLNSLSGEPDHLIDGSRLKDCNSVLECLKAMAMGMIFSDNNFYIYRDYTAGKRTPVQVFVKGMPVDVNTLATMNANEIESVEIFLKDQLGLINSSYGTNGVISVNMKVAPVGEKLTLQQLRDLLPQKNEQTLIPKGYPPVKVFYMPRYEGPRSSQPTKFDTRTTIYWNPNIEIDKTGTSTIEFYNADSKATYKVIIEGMDKDGDLGRYIYTFNVN